VGEGVQALKLANVGGVFVVLVGGCIVAALLTCCEFFYKSRHTPAAPGVMIISLLLAYKKLRRFFSLL
jgi:hypothetical protein